MGVFTVVPNELRDRVDATLDEKMPEAATDEDREALRAELMQYVVQHGRVPDFEVRRRARSEADGGQEAG